MKKIIAALFVLNFTSGITMGQSWTYMPIPSSYTLGYEVTAGERTAAELSLVSPVYLVDYLPAGYVVDGSADYRLQLQNGINAANTSTPKRDVVFPNFPVKTSPNTSSYCLQLFSDTKYYFPENSKLILPTTSSYNFMLRLFGIHNTILYYPNIEGDKYTHPGDSTTAANCIGINCKNSSNITFYKPVIKKIWGTGLYIGRDIFTAAYKSKNFLINNAIIEDNAGQGMTIASVDSLTVNGMLSANNSRVSDNGVSNGIHIEPTNSNQEINNLNLRFVTTFNNLNDGIYIWLGYMKSSVGKEVNMNILSHVDDHSLRAASVNLALASEPSAWLPLTGKINFLWPSWKNKANLSYPHVRVTDYRGNNLCQVQFDWSCLSFTEGLLHNEVRDDLHTVFTSIPDWISTLSSELRWIGETMYHNPCIRLPLVHSMSDTPNPKVYPNPAQSDITIDFGTDIKDGILQLRDINGRIMITKNVSGRSAQLEIASLIQGVYFIEIADATNNITLRFVKS